MIRFIDLTEAYWTYGGAPCCAFLDTTTDEFIPSSAGQVFDFPEEVNGIKDPDLRARCVALVPAGFWGDE